MPCTADPLPVPPLPTPRNAYSTASLAEEPHSPCHFASHSSSNFLNWTSSSSPDLVYSRGGQHPRDTLEKPRYSGLEQLGSMEPLKLLLCSLFTVKVDPLGSIPMVNAHVRVYPWIFVHKPPPGAAWGLSFSLAVVVVVVCFCSRWWRWCVFEKLGCDSSVRLRLVHNFLAN